MVVIVILILILFCWFKGFSSNKVPTIRQVCIVATLMVLLAGLRGEGVDNDYPTYVNMYEYPPPLVEPSFLFIRFIAQVIGVGAVGIFVIYAAIGVSLKIKAIVELTPLVWFSLVIYLSNLYILHDLNQIRAGAASAVILLMIKPIYERKLWRFLLLALLASLFHYSALLSFLLYPLLYNKTHNRGTIWVVLPFLGYVFFFISFQVDVFSLIPIEGVRVKLEMYRDMQEAGVDGYSQVNLFNPHTIFRLTLFLLLILKFELLNRLNKYFPILIKIYSMALFSFTFLSALTPLLGYRVSELFGVVEIILYPMIFYLFKPSLYSKFIIVFMGLLLFAVDVFYKRYIFL